MKKIYLLSAFLFFNSILLNAQVEAVLDPTGSGITGFFLEGNDLYYTQSDDIYKIDITATSASPILLVDGLSEPSGLLLDGYDLYVAQATANKVSKIDISLPTPTITDVVLGLNEPAFLALNGSDLYISEVGGGKISKIDITNSFPTVASDVVTGLSVPLDIELIGNELYITEVEADRISKINITDSAPISATVVATGFNKPLQIAHNGNDLYISETDGNKISKIDVSASLPIIPADVLTTNINSPECLASNSSHLYFSASSASAGFSRIARASFATLSLAENIADDSVTLFPNPSKRLIQVSGISKNEQYTIYNILGAKIRSGSFANTDTIIIVNLTNGAYFLKLESGKTLKFIKD